MSLHYTNLSPLFPISTFFYLASALQPLYVSGTSSLCQELNEQSQEKDWIEAHHYQS